MRFWWPDWPNRHRSQALASLQGSGVEGAVGREGRSSVSRPRVASAILAARQAAQEGDAASAAPATSARRRAGQAVEKVEAADGRGASLGSAEVDFARYGAFHRFEAVERAVTISGPLRKSARRAQRGLTPQLVWATARAAKATGRQPEEVWAEALQEWLAQQAAQGQGMGAGGTGSAGDAGGAELTLRQRMVDARRRQHWSYIDETLGALRVS